jgi:hypothetical protein
MQAVRLRKLWGPPQGLRYGAFYHERNGKQPRQTANPESGIAVVNRGAILDLNG